MHDFSILHIPGTVDACPLNGLMHLRFRVLKGMINSAKLIYNCDKNKWHISRLESPMLMTFTDSQAEYYSTAVELTDTRFAYIFELSCRDGVIRYLSEEGLSESYDHSLGYFNFFQYTSQFECDTMKVHNWVKTAVCYQIFPERFAIGNEQKDISYINTKWGEKPHPKSFCGGDLNGIREKLPYLSELGVNVIYMTPVFVSPSNHKYDIVDYENVDPSFGGNDALKMLIDKAHELGIKILLDGVFNHISWQHPFYLDAKEKGRASKYYDWFFFNEDGSYKTFGSVEYMPKLNTGNKDVINYFSSVAVKWMREYGADGWRLDVSDEISHKFLRAFREKVFEENPESIIIGEDWHRAVRYLNGDEYDGVMNYGVTKACLDLLCFENIDSAKFRDRLVQLYHTYSIAANENMLNLLGSHDTDRFLTRVKGSSTKFNTAAAVMFFYPGIPCIYYGDEIGTEGGFDPDCRRCFDWNEAHWNRDIFEHIKLLIKLKKEPALSEGSFEIDEKGGLVTITRRSPKQTAVLNINATEAPNAGLPAFGCEIKVY